MFFQKGESDRAVLDFGDSCLWLLSPFGFDFVFNQGLEKINDSNAI
jgi:hypothetical protein